MLTDTIHPDIARAISNDHLQLIVNPTERCNLRCVYCYETFTLGKMPSSVAAGILNLVKRRVDKGLQTLQLEFFGGEPLAAWDVVENLARGISAICRAGGTTLYGSMTTNGILLTPGYLDELVKSDVTSFQITLDGPKNIHDQRRVSIRDEGSFEAVWSTLQMLKEAPYSVEVLLRIHFDPTTVCSLLGAQGFIKKVVTEFIQNDDRFRLHFHAIGRWGGPNDSKIPVVASETDEQAAVERLLDAAIDAGAEPRQFIQSRRDATVGESGHAICYAASANAFLIRSDGRVGKCTVALEDDRNTVGRICENGDLVIDQDRHLPWLQGLISGDSVFLTCPARTYLWGKQGGDVLIT